LKVVEFREKAKPMIKVTFCLRRKSTLSVEAFQDHWLNIHAPLVRKHQTVLRIVQYIQLHTDHGELTRRLTRFRASPEPYDGVAELWYTSKSDLAALGDDPEARAASRELRDDEERFVDLGRSPIWVSEQKSIIPEFADQPT